MTTEDNFENPLDDELLAELGLEPKPAVKPREEAVPRKKAPPAPESPKEKKTEASESVSSSGQAPVPVPPPSSVSTKTINAADSFRQEIKNLAQDMPVQLVAVFGKKTIALKDLIALKPGEIVELKKLPNEWIDLVANGKLVAKGELVLVEGKVGIQIRQLV